MDRFRPTFPRTPLLLVFLLALALPPRALPRPQHAGGGDGRPRNLILLISDGCGAASFDLARAVAGHPLALDAVRTGRVLTASANDRVTDSAAGATAYATGVRTVNRRVGRDPLGTPLTSWFSGVSERGLATGLVVTTDVTDATPAAFVAHVHDRGAEDSVAVQILERRPDVVLGGGRVWFEPRGKGGRRDDGRDLLAEARRSGYQVLDGPGALGHDLDTPCIGLFAPESFEYVLDRGAAPGQPSLGAMAGAALRRLARAPHGFVLVVEGSLIDHAGHRNDPAAHAREVLEYDDMAAAMLEFARGDGHTLVISLSDHETGGLAFDPPGARGGLDPAPLRSQHASSVGLAGAIGRTHAPDSVLAHDWDGGGLEPSDRARIDRAGDDDLRGRVLAAIASRRAHVRWLTTGHTATDVPLFAFGPGAERFRGALENREVGRRIAALLGVRSGYVAGR